MARNREQVEAFYRAALAAGGKEPTHACHERAWCSACYGLASERTDEYTDGTEGVHRAEQVPELRAAAQARCGWARARSQRVGGHRGPRREVRGAWQDADEGPHRGD